MSDEPENKGEELPNGVTDKDIDKNLDVAQKVFLLATIKSFGIAEALKYAFEEDKEFVLSFEGKNEEELAVAAEVLSKEYGRSIDILKPV